MRARGVLGVLLSTPPNYFLHPSPLLSSPLTYLQQVGPTWDWQFSSHKRV
ncbi:hypothetical protein Hanom_Chr09g00762661 [Helianthus anomalus]